MNVQVVISRIEDRKIQLNILYQKQGNTTQFGAKKIEMNGFRERLMVSSGSWQVSKSR